MTQTTFSEMKDIQDVGSTGGSITPNMGARSRPLTPSLRYNNSSSNNIKNNNNSNNYNYNYNYNYNRSNSFNNHDDPNSTNLSQHDQLTIQITHITDNQSIDYNSDNDNNCNNDNDNYKNKEKAINDSDNDHDNDINNSNNKSSKHMQVPTHNHPSPPDLELPRSQNSQSLQSQLRRRKSTLDSQNKQLVDLISKYCILVICANVSTLFVGLWIVIESILNKSLLGWSILSFDCFVNVLTLYLQFSFGNKLYGILCCACNDCCDEKIESLTIIKVQHMISVSQDQEQEQD